MPSYCFDNLPERYNESLLKTTKLTMKENEIVTKKTKKHLDQIKVTLPITAYTY